MTSIVFILSDPGPQFVCVCVCVFVYNMYMCACVTCTLLVYKLVASGCKVVVVTVSMEPRREIGATSIFYLR